MPFDEWRALNQDILSNSYRFSDIEDRFLEIITKIDELRRNGKIGVGEYRQKGNLWRDMIIALIKARREIRIGEKRLVGRTDVHIVDFAYLKSISSRDVPIIAGEAKMLGSPAHMRPSGERYPERPVSIDLDKRIKEVKYTSVDLKRKFGISFSEGWKRWIDESYPKFYSFWGCRIGERNNLSSLIKKFTGVTEYNNGCGVFIYEDESYQKLIDERLDAFSIDKVIDSINYALKKPSHGGSRHHRENIS